MAEIGIDFQEGFDRDSVVLEIDGREVYRKDAVSTRYQISLADTVNVDCPNQEVSLRVRLPKRNLTGQIKVDAARPAYVGVSVIAGGELRFQVAREPFGYL